MNRPVDDVMAVIRYCPETGDEVEIEVEIEGYPVSEDAETGQGWGIEDVWGYVHAGTAFELSDRELDRAANILASTAEDRASARWDD